MTVICEGIAEAQIVFVVFVFPWPAPNSVWAFSPHTNAQKIPRVGICRA